jgi:type VI secretion system protein ImpK
MPKPEDEQMTSMQINDPMRMTSTEGDTAKIDAASHQLRQFYLALQRIAVAAQGLNQEQSKEGAAKISDRLIELIELQTLEAQRQGGRMSLDKEAHARYIKAALADEFLLALDWEGRGYWRQWLLEERLFNSSQAGEKIFYSVDAILSSRDPSHRGVALLYLYALSLGFQGQFRSGEELETLAVYRRDLFQFVYQRPAEASGRERFVSDGAYQSTISHLIGDRAPKLSRGKLFFGLSFLILLVVSQVIWLFISLPLEEILNSSPAFNAIASKK